ncbi:hypothetical protein LINGRAHAP2_LOCUS8319 [Linum grandiflorum]
MIEWNYSTTFSPCALSVCSLIVSRRWQSSSTCSNVVGSDSECVFRTKHLMEPR